MLDAIRQHAQSWGVKIAFGIIILVFVFWGLGNVGSNKKGQVVATVNDKPIPGLEFQRGYSRSVDAMRRQNPNLTSEDMKKMDVKRQVLNQMILARLLNEDAAKMGLSVSTAEIQYAIKAIPAFQDESHKFDPARYQALLQSNHLSPAEFEGQFRQELLRRKIESFVGSAVLATETEAHNMFTYAQEQTRIDYVLFDRAAYEKDVTPSAQEIDDYYNKHLDEFKEPARIKLQYVSITPADLAKKISVSDEDIAAFYESKKEKFVIEEAVKARHILIKVAPNASEADAQKAKDEITKIAAQLKKGAKFEDLARKYSQSPDKAQGGELGWFPRDTMLKPFEDAAFALKPGQVSEPVRTEYGWHLIQVEDHRDGGQQTLDQVKDSIRTTLAEERASDQMGALVDGFSDKVVSGEPLEKVAEEYGLAPQTSEFFTKAQGFAGANMKPQAMDTLFALAVGAPTDTPITLDDGYLFAKKVDEQPEHTLALDQVKDKVVKGLKSQGASAIAEKKAQDAAAALSSGKADAAKDYQVKQSELFGRRGAIVGLGANPELMDTAFRAEPGKWLPKAYAVATGFVAARPSAPTPPSDERWAKEKDLWMQIISQNKKNEMFQAYTSELMKTAKIQIITPELLNE